MRLCNSERLRMAHRRNARHVKLRITETERRMASQCICIAFRLSFLIYFAFPVLIFIAKWSNMRLLCLFAFTKDLHIHNNAFPGLPTHFAFGGEVCINLICEPWSLLVAAGPMFVGQASTARKVRQTARVKAQLGRNALDAFRRRTLARII